MSLRRRLFVYVFIPVAILYLAFGFFGVYQTRNQLISDIDDRLKSESANVAALLDVLPVEDIAEIIDSSIEVDPTQLRVVVDTRTDEVVIVPSVRDGQAQPLPATDEFLPAELVGSLDTPFTVTAADGDLSYRAIATRLNGGRIGVFGEPLDRIDSLTRQFVIGTLVNGAILLSAMAGVVWFAVRHGLRPLGAFVASTTRVAEGDLSERVDTTQNDPAFAAIAAATNSMLDQVEISYEQQRIGRERLNELVDDAAHELRTPLTALRGTIDMQKMGAIDSADKTRAAFRGMDEHTARMQHIVEELIVIARAENIQADVQAQARSILDVEALTGREVAAARRSQPNRSILISVDEPGLEIAGDEQLLATALKQVFDNALIHTPIEADVRVHIESTSSEVAITISDDGPGVAPEIRDRVFERFVRADVSRSRATGGAGLGLPIVKSAVESVGGSVSYEHREPSGSTFVLRFPRYVRSGKPVAG